MRRTCALILCLVFVAVLLTACATEVDTCDQLVVYNWADYIYDFEDDFVEYYKELTGRDIEVTYVTFDTNETMLAKIQKGDSVVDVMCPSEYAIEKLLQADMLIKLNYFNEDEYIDTDKLNDYEHFSDNVDKQIVDKVSRIFTDIGSNHADMIDYMVPYMYGTLGILYNKVYFEEIGLYDSEDLEATRELFNKANWGILFNDDGEGNILSEDLTNHIYMKDSIRDSYAATVSYLQERGYLDGLTVCDENSSYYGTPYNDLPASVLINTVDSQLLAKCSEVLKEQKTQLYGYEVDFGKNELISGVAYVDLAWSGDALYAVEESWSDEYDDYTLAYFVPHTAGNIWFDGWVIPKTCRHEEAARIFVNFLNRTDVAVNNMMEIGYSSAVDPEVIRADSDALDILVENEYDVEEFLDYVDPIDDCNWRYPFVITEGNEYGRSIDDLGVMRDFGVNNTAVVTMWEDVRSTGITAVPLLLITLGGVALVVGVVALVYFVRRRQEMYVVIDE